MKEQKTYYKVLCHNRCGKLVSSYVEGKQQKTYTPNKITKASKAMLSLGYGLFVYDDFQIAKTIATHAGNEVWEVIVDEVVPIPAMLMYHGDFTARYLKKALESKSTELRSLKDLVGTKSAKATVVVNKLRLIKRVK